MKKDQRKVVYGIYENQVQLERAVDTLKADGFRNSDISVLMPEKGDTQSFAHERGTKAPEGATAGVASGAVAGGALGWLVGIGTLAIPGVGPFIAAGPIMSALAGVGIGGALGGVTGALIGMGIPEYEAKRYSGLVKDGGILLSVHADDHEWVEKGKKVLERTGAIEIDSTSEAKGVDGTERSGIHDDRTTRV